jgi:hypothetical protein
MTFALNPDVSISEAEDGMVLLDQRSGRYWQLNVTGARIVRLLLDGRTTGDVVDELRAKHPDGGDQVATDVAGLLDHLRRAELVRS